MADNFNVNMKFSETIHKNISNGDNKDIYKKMGWTISRKSTLEEDYNYGLDYVILNKEGKEYSVQEKNLAFPSTSQEWFDDVDSKYIGIRYKCYYKTTDEYKCDCEWFKSRADYFMTTWIKEKDKAEVINTGNATPVKCIILDMKKLMQHKDEIVIDDYDTEMPPDGKCHAKKELINNVDDTYNVFLKIKVADLKVYFGDDIVVKEFTAEELAEKSNYEKPAEEFDESSWNRAIDLAEAMRKGEVDYNGLTAVANIVEVFLYLIFKDDCKEEIDEACKWIEKAIGKFPLKDMDEEPEEAFQSRLVEDVDAIF